jgi:hypothetical protein
MCMEGFVASSFQGVWANVGQWGHGPMGPGIAKLINLPGAVLPILFSGDYGARLSKSQVGRSRGVGRPSFKTSKPGPIASPDADGDSTLPVPFVDVHKLLLPPEFIEPLLHRLAAIVEDGRQPAPHQPRRYPPQKAERKQIVDQVPNLHAPRNLPEMVLVVPEAIRAEALLVDKEVWFPAVCDFSHPGERQTQKGTHRVGDDHAGIHVDLGRRGYPEAK